MPCWPRGNQVLPALINFSSARLCSGPSGVSRSSFRSGTFPWRALPHRSSPPSCSSSAGRRFEKRPWRILHNQQESQRELLLPQAGFSDHHAFSSNAFQNGMASLNVNQDGRGVLYTSLAGQENHLYQAFAAPEKYGVCGTSPSYCWLGFLFAGNFERPHLLWKVKLSI